MPVSGVPGLTRNDVEWRVLHCQRLPYADAGHGGEIFVSCWRSSDRMWRDHLSASVRTFVHHRPWPFGDALCFQPVRIYFSVAIPA